MTAAKVNPSVEETKEASKDVKTSGSNGTSASSADEALKEKKAKVSRKNKNYYLLTAEVEQYADDSELYKPRISREMRVEYWQKMLDQRVRRERPENAGMTYQEAWMAGDYDTEGPTYPSLFVLQLAIVKSKVWDYAYLIFLFLYLVINIAVYDGLGSVVASQFGNIGNSTMTSLPVNLPFSGNMSPEIAANAAALGLSSATMILPVVAMLLVQIPPSLGIFYFVTRCNDLVKYKARTTIFGGWAFVSIFIGQALEYFLYGGADNLDGAGKCAFSQKTMGKFFKQKKTKIGNLDALYEREQISDEEDEFQDDPYPEGHESIDERIVRAREALAADPTNPELQALVQGQQEMSYLQKILTEKRQKEQDEIDRIKAEEQLRESTCTDWTEWECMVCKKQNRRPTHPPSISDVFFGSKGIFYKRTFAIIRARRDAPQCHFCRTYKDYVPPLGSAHMFPYNKAPYRAFAKYPIKPLIQAGLENTAFSRFANSVYSYFFGLRDNSSSKLAYNDWRLRIYLNGNFPEIPRQKKKTDELYKVGEFLECKLQKSDWARCRVTKARANHTYDLVYDPGDELRLVPESELRMMPEKRTYAYYVELVVVFLVISFPVGIIASQTIQSSLLTFCPMVGSLFLLVVRIAKFLKYMRHFKFAGIIPILKLTLFYTFPLMLLLGASLAPLMGTNWVTVSYWWIATQFLSLPVLYIMKPNFAVFALILFLQTSAGFYLLARYVEGSPLSQLMAVNMAPLLTAVLTLMYYRKNLWTLIDVSMVIRPPLNFIKPESLFSRIYNFFFPDPARVALEAEVAAEKAKQDASMEAL